MDLLLKHKAIAGLVIVAIVGIAWYMLGGSAPADSGSVITTETSASVPPEAQQLVESLLTLRAVSLDGTIFTNPSFQTLHDFSTPVLPEPVGRDNPFAPLDASGDTGPVSATSTRTNQMFAPKR